MIDVSIEGFLIEGGLQVDTEHPLRRVTTGIPEGAKLVAARMQDEYLVLSFDDGKKKLTDLDIEFHELSFDDIRFDAEYNEALDMTLFDLSYWKDGQVACSVQHQSHGKVKRSKHKMIQAQLRTKLHRKRKKKGLI